MQSITIFDKNFERTLKEFPEKRAAAVKMAGEIALSRVANNIAVRINSSSGKVAKWQHIRLGSKGGFSVVEAVGGEDAKAVAPFLPSSGNGSPGAITNAIECGHKIRKPKESGRKGYRARIKRSSVDGRWFYRATEADVSRIAMEAAEKVCGELAKTLAGG